jgi:replicative DNA helicase Mcm
MIIYARKYIDPQFKDKEVLKAIEDFFVKWRSTAEAGTSPIPITPRQLEALVRLAKANARMRLSKEVTIEDANRAIDLVKRSLQEAGIDPESGKVDVDILMTGKSRSQRQNMERIMEIIKGLEGQFGGAAPIDEVKKLASAEGIRERFVDQMIEEEERRGHLYEPKPGLISRAVK